VSNQAFTKPEVKGESCDRGSADRAPSRRCWGMEPPKMAAFVVRPLKTNAGVHRNVLHSCYKM